MGLYTADLDLQDRRVCIAARGLDLDRTQSFGDAVIGINECRRTARDSVFAGGHLRCHGDDSAARRVVGSGERTVFLRCCILPQI
jgi:hypothetical protein